MPKTPKKLFKTTIIIWSEYNGLNVELEDLAREATCGDAYCSKQESIEVDPNLDEDWDKTDFFDFEEDENG